MHYLYILKSIKHEKFYIGSTSDLSKRFEDHNCGRANYTSKYKPWKLIYYEAYTSLKLAQARERKLKAHGKGLSELKKRITEQYED